MTRRVETELAPTCQELGVSIQAYSPLEQGLLTGKVTETQTFAPGDVRNNNPQFQPERRRKALALLARWQPVCQALHCSPAALVIALTAEMLPGLHVLCGARKPAQVEDNASAMALALSAGDLARLKADVEELLG